MATPKRTGLGRGIGALIPGGDDSTQRPVDVFFPSGTGESQGLLAVPGARLANLAPDDIAPNAVQPRTEFRQEELDELVVSIREIGVLQPIVRNYVKCNESPGSTNPNIPVARVPVSTIASMSPRCTPLLFVSSNSIFSIAPTTSFCRALPSPAREAPMRVITSAP